MSEPTRFVPADEAEAMKVAYMQSVPHAPMLASETWKPSPPVQSETPNCYRCELPVAHRIHHCA